MHRQRQKYMIIFYTETNIIIVLCHAYDKIINDCGGEFEDEIHQRGGYSDARTAGNIAGLCARSVYLHSEKG